MGCTKPKHVVCNTIALVRTTIAMVWHEIVKFYGILVSTCTYMHSGSQGVKSRCALVRICKKQSILVRSHAFSHCTTLPQESTTRISSQPHASCSHIIPTWKLLPGSVPEVLNSHSPTVLSHGQEVLTVVSDANG